MVVRQYLNGNNVRRNTQMSVKCNIQMKPENYYFLENYYVL